MDVSIRSTRRPVRSRDAGSGRTTRLAALLCAALLGGVCAPAGAATATQPHPGHATAKPAAPTTASHPGVAAAYGHLPLSFEANTGQYDPAVKYLAHGAGYDMFLTDHDTFIALHPPARPRDHPELLHRLDRPTTARSVPARASSVPAKPGPVTMLRLHPVGAAAGKLQPSGRLPGVVNYLIGKDRSRWHTGIGTWSQVRTSGLWPGIEMAWHGNGTAPEYDLNLAPGADVAAARFDITGARSLELNPRGDLLITTAQGVLTEHAPNAWQDIDGKRSTVPAAWHLLGAHRVGFRLGAHDPTRALTIDPTLAWSTYLGGNTSDQASGIAVDPTGAAYIAGQTDSTNFPTMNPYQPHLNHLGGESAFVTKLNPAGSALVYSTYLGGNFGDVAAAIAVDPTGAAYITGETDSTNFPTMNPYQANPGAPGATNAFVTKLNPTGNTLAWSTYLGGSNFDQASGIAVDPTGAAYVTGYTRSSDFPTMNPYQGNPGATGAQNAFVTKFNPAGNTLAWSTYLGGSNFDQPTGIAVDPTGAAYITGATQSSDYPTKNPYQAHLGDTGALNPFVTKLNPAGNTLAWSTYLGGSTSDEATGIAVDPTGAAYITGLTASSDFPTRNPYQAHLGATGAINAFVTKLNPTGSALVYSTYLGGSTEDAAFGIAVDPTGAAYVTGLTESSDFPTRNPYQAHPRGRLNAFVTKFDAVTTGPGAQMPSPSQHHRHCGNNDPNPNTSAGC